jgi:hypothetical protein
VPLGENHVETDDDGLGGFDQTVRLTGLARIRQPLFITPGDLTTDLGCFVKWPGSNLPLPGLKPGLHRLEARAWNIAPPHIDSTGEVDPTPACLDFTVLPSPLQQRPWFKPVAGLLLVLIAGLSWLAIRRTWQIAHTYAALRQENAEHAMRGRQGRLEHSKAILPALISCSPT